MSEKEKLKEYEAVIILKNETSENISEVKEKIEIALKNNQSTLISKEDWGVKEMFNSKYSNGYFFYIIFSALPNLISSIKKEWNINTDIIKYTLIKK